MVSHYNYLFVTLLLFGFQWTFASRLIPNRTRLTRSIRYSEISRNLGSQKKLIPTAWISCAYISRQVRSFPLTLVPCTECIRALKLVTRSMKARGRSSVFSSFEESWNSLVGPSGLEPPTSCLSGTRSNLLSYEPMWLVSDFLSHLVGGDDGIRTHDPLLAGQVLSQLSYTPIKWFVVFSILSIIGVDCSTPRSCQHWAIFPYSRP